MTLSFFDFCRESLPGPLATEEFIEESESDCRKDEDRALTESGVAVLLEKLFCSVKAVATRAAFHMPHHHQKLPLDRETVIFLDWDDTLLCTSFLSGRSVTSPQLRAQMARMARTVEALLREAVGLGTVYIVTNAEEGWVEASAKIWLPEVLPLLQNVPIISARTRFEEDYPDQPFMWKLRTFSDLTRHIPPEVFANVISIGDSPYEISAARALVRDFDQSIVKTVKLQPRPSARALNQQLDFLIQELRFIERSTAPMNLAL